MCALSPLVALSQWTLVARLGFQPWNNISRCEPGGLFYAPSTERCVVRWRYDKGE